MRNLFTFALKAAVSCILLYVAFAHVNFDLIGRQLNHIRYSWLTAAVLTLIGQILVGALRWQKIVRRCNRSDEPRRSVACAHRQILNSAGAPLISLH
jgi:uncharacterized membrane protein YbhN (UPF0104 family)